MSSERVVRIVLTGDSAGLVRALRVGSDAAVTAQTKLERLQSVGRGMTSLGRSMTMLAAPLVALGAYSVKTAATFQSSMEMIHTQAGQSQASVDSLSKSLLNMAPSVGTSTTDLAAGLYHVESAGYHGAAALQMLKIAAEGAKVGGANLVDVTNAMDAAVVSGIKGVSNYRQAMGALNATVGAGDMTMQNLADALGTGLLATMKTFGVSLGQTGAALAVFGDNNIRGADAATKLASAVRIMGAPSAAGAKALATVGVSSLQLANDMRSPGGLVTALSDLKSHLIASGETASQQAATLTDAFGRKQSTGVLLLIDQLSRLRTKVADVSKGATGFGSAWQATQKNISFQWDKLKATGQVALIHLGDALMPLVTKMLPPLVRDFSAVVGWISHLPKPVLDVVIAFTAFLAIGGPILMFIGGLITAIGTVGTVMETLGITMEALPFVAVFAAISVGVILLLHHLQQVKQVAGDVFNWLKTAVSTVGHVFSSVFGTLYHVMTYPFVKGWSVIKSIFAEIKKGVMVLFNDTPFGTMIHLMGGVLGGGKDLLMGHPGAAANAFAGGLSGALHSATFGLLSKGGLVPKYFAGGGPVGTDTVPAFLTPGEYVLDRAATARVGIGALNALNSGSGAGGGGTILEATLPVAVSVDGRVLLQAVVRQSKKVAARGPTSLVGGGLMTGGVTP